jgi:hypothetical protein
MPSREPIPMLAFFLPDEGLAERLWLALRRREGEEEVFGIFFNFHIEVYGRKHFAQSTLK